MVCGLTANKSHETHKQFFEPPGIATLGFCDLGDYRANVAASDGHCNFYSVSLHHGRFVFLFLFFPSLPASPSVCGAGIRSRAGSRSGSPCTFAKIPMIDSGPSPGVGLGLYRRESSATTTYSMMLGSLFSPQRTSRNVWYGELHLAHRASGLSSLSLLLRATPQSVPRIYAAAQSKGKI